MWWLIGLAAAEIMLLSTPVSKEEGQSLKKQCEEVVTENGIDVDTARYFVSGRGYVYRVSIEGFETIEEAKETVQSLDDDGTVDTEFVLVVDGREISAKPKKPLEETVEKLRERLVREAVDPIPPQQKDLSPKVEHKVANKKKKNARLAPTVQDVLLHAVDAHQEITTNWQEVQTESFRFLRERPQEGSIIQHHYYRSADNMRLDIIIQKGEGVNSTTVVPDEGEGWVSSEQKKVSRNAIRTRELLARFSSRNILSVPFTIAQEIEKGAYWDRMTLIADDGDLWTLTRAEENGIVSASFYQDSWLVASLVVQDTDRMMEYEFADYRVVEGLGMIPHSIQIIQGDILVEALYIDSLNVSDEISESIFEGE